MMNLGQELMPSPVMVNPLEERHDDDIMVALIPKAPFWCKIDLPHMTLVYAGKVGNMDLSDLDDLERTTKFLAHRHRPQHLRVRKPGVLGTTKKVDVLHLELTPELASMRRVVSYWNKSEHKKFRPHVTVGPKGSISPPLPSVITFEHIGIFWGSESTIFPFLGRTNR